MMPFFCCQKVDEKCPTLGQKILTDIEGSIEYSNELVNSSKLNCFWIIQAAPNQV